jgi:ATP/maltotriose-dependent transcriptional regulator MalT
LRNAAVELPAEQRVLLALDDYHLITAPAIQ